MIRTSKTVGSFSLSNFKSYQTTSKLYMFYMDRKKSAQETQTVEIKERP